MPRSSPLPHTEPKSGNAQRRARAPHRCAGRPARRSCAPPCPPHRPSAPDVPMRCLLRPPPNPPAGRRPPPRRPPHGSTSRRPAWRQRGSPTAGGRLPSRADRLDEPFASGPGNPSHSRAPYARNVSQPHPDGSTPQVDQTTSRRTSPPLARLPLSQLSPPSQRHIPQAGNPPKDSLIEQHGVSTLQLSQLDSHITRSLPASPGARWQNAVVETLRLGGKGTNAAELRPLSCRVAKANGPRKSEARKNCRNRKTCLEHCGRMSLEIARCRLGVESKSNWS